MTHKSKVAKTKDPCATSLVWNKFIEDEIGWIFMSLGPFVWHKSDFFVNGPSQLPQSRFFYHSDKWQLTHAGEQLQISTGFFCILKKIFKKNLMPHQMKGNLLLPHSMGVAFI